MKRKEQATRNQTASVLDRYSDGAKAREEALCCPVDYDTSLLKMLPEEIVERDYGCGDPSRYVQLGDTVLDLGSGGGKICYMAAQLVGESGTVIGIDMNDDMLALAREHQADMAEQLGGDRVTFHKGLIQDLALDLEDTANYLESNPIKSPQQLIELQAHQREQRRTRPLMDDNSVDLVVSNCVLNLVSPEDRRQMIAEIFRVLKPGGRVAISDIVADEAVPQHLQDDPELWSGCISGAFQEQAFLQAFLDAGFVAVAYDKWQAEPWQVVEDIEFRSVTLTATRQVMEECLDYGHAVIYKGPFSEVSDDDGHVFPRGERMAVCEHTFRLLTEGPYREQFIGIAPAQLGEPRTWCAPAGTRRPATETRGGSHRVDESVATGGCC